MPSTLEARLRRLRGGSPAAAATQPGGEQADNNPGDETRPPSLAERLSRLAPARTARARERTPNEAALAERIGAVAIAPGVLLLERNLPRGRRHGRIPLSRPEPPVFLPLPPAWAAEPPSPEHWICLDTETSGLAGGTGTWAFVTGLLRWQPDGWRLRQYLLCRLDAEAEYLRAIAAALAPPAALVSYNGRSFDAPLLAARFRLAGLPDPLAALPHLDLLAPVRRAFSGGWPNCRLATAESRLLGFERSDDLPGAAAPRAWLAWLREGRVGPLAAVLRHNRDDLLSLVALVPALDRVYRDPGIPGADPRSVAASHAARGDLPLARAILLRHRSALCDAGLSDLAHVHRRLGEWPRAVAIWEILERSGDPGARAALARYHEHRSGDLARALSLADALPRGEERERRRARLEAKLEIRARNLCFTGW